MMNSVIPFHNGSTICVAGCTNSGKSFFVRRLLEQQQDMFVSKPYEILYCYGIYQPLFAEMEQTIPNISFHEGFPSIERVKELGQQIDRHNILVLDDLCEETVNREEGKNIFTRLCHHLNISAILISQNLFSQGKYARTISLNVHYFCLLKTTRSGCQIQHLNRQIYGPGDKTLIDAYTDCMKTPFSYMLIDLSPKTDERYRLRTNIFPGEQCFVYRPKKT